MPCACSGRTPLRPDRPRPGLWPGPAAVRDAPRTPGAHRVRTAASRLLLTVGEAGRHLADEATGDAVVARTEHGPGAGIGEVQVPLSPRDADVAEPALLLEPPLVERPGVREDP